MKVKELKLKGSFLISPKIICDNRGYFFESYSKKKLNNILEQKIDFVQDNQSKSKKGVIRGFHFQKQPYAQGKLIRAQVGKIFDVIIDIRKESETYGEFDSVIISSSNKLMLWIPPGFAHGFQSMTNNAVIIYKTSNYYHKESEVSINPFDSEIGVTWPIDSLNISLKDKTGIDFKIVKKDKLFYV